MERESPSAWAIRAWGLPLANKKPFLRNSTRWRPPERWPRRVPDLAWRLRASWRNFTAAAFVWKAGWEKAAGFWCGRSEEHTSELQSLRHLVCRLLVCRKTHFRSGRKSTRLNSSHLGRSYALFSL